MKTRTADLLCLASVAVVSGVAGVLYGDLPDPVPTHWNAAGDVDGYTGKPWGVIILPISAVGLWLLMKAIPHMSPKGYGTREFQGVVNLLQVMMVAFMSAIGVLALLAANGANIPIDVVIPIGVGLLFIALANYFGKLRKNFFIGIRTPWTIASDEVWARTHRLAAKTFTLAGLIMASSAFYRPMPWVILVAVFIAAIVPILYSWWLYRKLEGFDNGNGDDSGPEDVAA